ncbi:MAG: phosphoribosylglycinamide formyltransferase [Armatimonadetes bacterium]|nr:phosphoribosylglycinamide formyltransferase [Armatimonadota bacterium]
MMRIAILVGPRSRGTNMEAIIQAAKSGVLPATVSIVVAPREDAPALEFARENGAPTLVLAPNTDTYAADLQAALREHGADIVCLAGFLSLLPASIVQSYRVMNIHPALLPAFGGKGMYGRKVHEAVLAAGVTETGCTVHWVSENYDEGEIILQKHVPVMPDDTAETLQARVLEQEHRAYVEALQMVCGMPAS